MVRAETPADGLRLSPVWGYAWLLSVILLLKALDKVGRSQRLVFSLGVSKLMHKLNLRNIVLIWSFNSHYNNERKNTIVALL